MKSFAPFAGNAGFISFTLALLIGFTLASVAYAEEPDLSPEPQPVVVKKPPSSHSILVPTLIGLAGVAAFYEISQMQKGSLVFALGDTMAAFYLLREVYGEDEGLDRLTVPLGLLSLAIVNSALLNDSNQFSDHDVFIYNTLGTGLIVAYALWDSNSQHPHTRRYGQVLPFINESHTGFAWSLRY